MKLFKKIRSDASGNVAMIFALTLLPIAAFVGAALDFSRQVQSEQDLQFALDSAVLRATNLLESIDPNVIIPETVEANLKATHLNSNGVNYDINVTNAPFSRSVEVTARAQLDTTLLSVIGIKTLDVTATSGAEQSTKFTEISLALDISSSMAGAKLASMQSASSQFVDTVFASGVPGRTHVNLIPFGGSVNIGEEFDDYVTPLAGAILDPLEADYDQTNLGEGNYRFSDGHNCVENTIDDFDIEDIPANSRSQVPHFWSFFNFNPWCPPENNAAIFIGDSPTDIKDTISNFTLSDGTGMHTGMLWALKALSPQLRGSFNSSNTRPRNFNVNRVTKVIVLMADGGISQQLRPLDPTSNTTNGGGNQNDGNLLLTQLEALDRMRMACDLAKDRNITVYTIAFEVNSIFAENTLRNCATTPDFFFDSTTVDLDATFAAIATSIGSLSLIQ